MENIGKVYYDHRKKIMLNLKLGLTKIYNLFHYQKLDVMQVEKVSKLDNKICDESFADIIKLRELHKTMDRIVLEAYGWTDVDLNHNFYEIDYLPENDRVRYTISPEARKEILKRLLKLNHEIHEKELAAGLFDKKKSKTKKKEDKLSKQGQKSFL